MRCLTGSETEFPVFCAAGNRQQHVDWLQMCHSWTSLRVHINLLFSKLRWLIVDDCLRPSPGSAMGGRVVQGFSWKLWASMFITNESVSLSSAKYQRRNETFEKLEPENWRWQDGGMGPVSVKTGFGQEIRRRTCIGACTSWIISQVGSGRSRCCDRHSRQTHVLSHDH